VGKLAKPVVEQRAGLSARDKPVAAKPGVLRRITNIVSNPQGTTSAAVKPKVTSTVTSLVAPRPILKAKPSIMQAKAKEEAKQKAPKPELAPAAVKPTFDFTEDQINTIELIDSRDRSNAVNAAEYVKDIYNYLSDLEVCI